MGIGGGLTGCIMASVVSRAVALMPGFGFVGALEITPMLIAMGILALIFTSALGGLIPSVGAVTANVSDQLRGGGCV